MLELWDKLQLRFIYLYNILHSFIYNFSINNERLVIVIVIIMTVEIKSEMQVN